MACSAQCILDGKHYVFHETTITYADAIQTCKTSGGGQLALANTPTIRTKLYECCKNDQEFWVAFTTNQLTPKTDGDCPMFKARPDSVTSSTCNSKRLYICEVPLPTTSNVITTTNPMTSQSANTSSLLATGTVLTATGQTNIGLIIGAVFAVILLLLLLVALYHYRLRHLNTKKFDPKLFKKCALGCNGGSTDASEPQPVVAPQEDHGYYRLGVKHCTRSRLILVVYRFKV